MQGPQKKAENLGYKYFFASLELKRERKKDKCKYSDDLYINKIHNIILGPIEHSIGLGLRFYLIASTIV